MLPSHHVEPLEHRRLRLHAFSAGLGLFAGLAATFGGHHHWGIILGPIAGFIASPLLTRWLLHKELAAAVPAATAASIAVSLPAGFIPHPLLAFAVAASGILITTRLLALRLHDAWPPDPNRCPRCHYDRRGVPGPICPECGHDASIVECLSCGYSLRDLPTLTCPECGHDNPPPLTPADAAHTQNRASGPTPT